LIRRGVDRRPPSNVRSVSEWKRRVKDKRGGEIELRKFGGTGKAKSKLRCSKGHTWLTTLSDIMEGHGGCPKCDYIRRQKPIFSVSEWKRRLKEEHGDEIELLEFGGNGHTKSKLRCAEGHTWSAILNSVVCGHGCPECYNIRERGLSLRLSEHEVDARLKSKKSQTPWKIHQRPNSDTFAVYGLQP
jgi:hypothetical protein